MPKTDMLINSVPGEECRIAIVSDGKLEELYQERASNESHVSSIYKGKVTNVEPSIQAAFIDFGLERNGFLHISDVHPMYFPKAKREDSERVGHKTPHRERPPIQQCLKRGQQIIVQVLKEGIGTKGPTLTSYLSIPGRFIVMMPHMEKLGVSRKVEDDDARREMRKLLNELDPPDNFGFIVRTAGIGRPKTELKRDLAYLQRLWKAMEKRRKDRRPVGELYSESDLVVRTIRDVFSTDIDRIIVDDPKAAQRARDFLAIANPRAGSRVFLYEEPIPLFHRFGVESQIDSINDRHVPMPSGGSLVIDSTEALVAIDVNSGKMREHRDAETTAYQTNIEAVEEVCRQLRLRDLGGVVVIDLIDMRETKKRRSIEGKFRDRLKRDRARTRIGSISQFGMLEMTRQRMRPSLTKSTFQECTHCNSLGYVKSPESVVLDVMRRLAVALQDKRIKRVELTISPDVAFQLLNRKRAHLVELESAHDIPVLVRVGGQSIDYINLTGYDANGGPIDLTEGGKKDKDPDLTVLDKRGRGPGVVDDEDLDDEDEQDEQDAEEASADSEDGGDGDDDDEQGEGRKRRRRRRGGRRRRGRGRKKDEGQDEETGSKDESDDDAKNKDKDSDDADSDDEGDSDNDKGDGDESSGKGGRRRRRRRGGRRRSRRSKSGSGDDSNDDNEKDGHADDSEKQGESNDDKQDGSDSDEDAGNDDGGSGGGRKKRSRGGRSRKKSGEDSSDKSEDDSKESDSADDGESSDDQGDDSGKSGGSQRRGRRGGRGRSKSKDESDNQDDDNSDNEKNDDNPPSDDSSDEPKDD